MGIRHDVIVVALALILAIVLVFALNWATEQFVRPSDEPATIKIEGNSTTILSYIGHTSFLRTAHTWYDREVKVYHSDPVANTNLLVRHTISEYHYPFVWEMDSDLEIVERDLLK